MASVFTRIIDGELPGVFVWKDDLAVGFLSINPLNRGHVLVVPRDEVDHWIKLDDDLARHLMSVSRVIGEALQRAFNPARIGLMIAGFEIPHCHVHVVPIDGMHHLDLANAATTVNPEELAAAARSIRSELRALERGEVAE
jgi:diadenosine tetraphosphate (Ap4A) HIT family hydrolase